MPDPIACGGNEATNRTIAKGRPWTFLRGSGARVSITDTNKKIPTPLHGRWVTDVVGVHLARDDRGKKSAPTRHTLRLKSLSLAQPPRGPTVSRTQLRSRSAPRRAREMWVTWRTKQGAELAVWVFVRNKLSRSARVTTS